MSCNQYADALAAVRAPVCDPRGGSDSGKDRDRREVALNASSGGVGPLPIVTTLFAAPLNVVSTTIDTRNIGRANNLLNFSSIINLPVGIILTLNFEITRSHGDGSPVNVGSTYTFSQTVATVLESQSFSFQFLDADVEPGFYTYSIRLSTNSFIDITPGCTIGNAVLSVLAVKSDR